MDSRNNLNKDVPEITKVTIDYLNKMYPEKSPSSSETHNKLMERSGEANVVRHLTYVHNLQFNKEPCVFLPQKLQPLSLRFKLQLQKVLLKLLS